MLAVCNYSVSEVRPQAWDSLIQQFTDATVFHSLAWLRTVSESHGVKLTLAQVENEGECHAVWPFLVTRKGPLHVFGSPLPGWSTAYMGPLFHEQADVPAALQAFMNHSLFRKHAYFACKVIDRHRPVDLTECGFDRIADFDTYRIDLAESEETLWSNLKSECRTRIRRATKLGVEIRPEESDAFIDEYWRMAVETFEKSGIQPTHTKQFLFDMWRNLQPVGSVCAASAFMEGKRIATLVLLIDDSTMYYWGGASYVQHRDVPAHNLLHWHMVREAQARGLREYDFISTCGGPGRFKKTFGPNTVHMATHWERSRSKWISVLKDQYQKYLLMRRRIKA